MSKFNYDLETLSQLHREGQLDAARQGYLTILRKNPQEVTALHALGIIAAQQEDFSTARDYLKKALSFNPKEISLYLHLANILKIQGLFNQAIETLQTALKISPDYPAALNNLGTLYFAQEQYDKAIDHYQKAIEKKSDYIDAYYNLGLTFAKLRQTSEAINTYQKLLELAPDYFAARFQLASTLMHTEDFSSAIEEFLRVEKTHPYHFETQTNLATCHLKKGDLNSAKSHYQRALELKPDDIQILFNLGFIHMQQGNLDHAIQSYQKAAQISPDDFSIHNNLAVAFLARKHMGLALHHFKEAARIHPENQSVLYAVDMLSQNTHLLAAPTDYVQSLFDGYADHYEAHLLNALDYQIPQLIYKALPKPKQNSWDILDLGCGTGLCGSVLKPFAKKLTGIDLSNKMLDIARSKNIYDELICDDLQKSLLNKKSEYDLIVAGDVLVYIGDLATLFSNARTALREKGLFIFNAEIEEKTDYKMTQSGRFAHTKKYIDQLAEKNHFKILNYEIVTTRSQNNEPVYGHLYTLTTTTFDCSPSSTCGGRG